MTDKAQALSSFFIAGWLLACALLLAGAIATWLHRIPGTTVSDFIRGPKGQPVPRLFHSASDSLRLVRSDRRRLVYGLQFTGATVGAMVVLGALIISFL